MLRLALAQVQRFANNLISLSKVCSALKRPGFANLTLLPHVRLVAIPLVDLQAAVEDEHIALVQVLSIQGNLGDLCCARFASDSRSQVGTYANVLVVRANEVEQTRLVLVRLHVMEAAAVAAFKNLNAATEAVQELLRFVACATREVRKIARLLGAP